MMFYSLCWPSNLLGRYSEVFRVQTTPEVASGLEAADAEHAGAKAGAEESIAAAPGA